MTAVNDGLIGKPLLVEIAEVLKHQGVCPAEILHYAGILHGIIFQAGLAYCESIHLGSEVSSVHCDMSWSWGVLDACRSAAHQQAQSNFGLTSEHLAQCFKQEVATIKNVTSTEARMDERIPWVLTLHLCNRTPKPLA